MSIELSIDIPSVDCWSDCGDLGGGSVRNGKRRRKRRR